MRVGWLILYLVLSVATTTLSVGMESASVYMQRSDFDDQATSASGYVFQANSGGPVTYSGYSDTTGALGNFGRPPIPLALHGPQQLQPQLVPAGVLQPPLHSYGYHGVPADYSAYVVPTLDQQDLQRINLAATLNGVPTLLGGQVLSYGGGYGGIGGGLGSGYGGIITNGDQFIREGGKKHDEEKHASHGEKGESGYRTDEGYQKGQQGKHNEESDKGYQKQEGAHHSSHHDAGEQYGKKEGEASGVNGQSFSHSTSHKRGKKTKGYHKTYHKDEYKKDHSFYDEADDRGHYSEYENHNSNHAAEHGAAEKGGHSVAGFREHEKGEKGHSDQGKHLDHESGFRASHGENAYHNNAAEYAKKAEKEAQQQHGYNELKAQNYAL